MPVRGPGPTSRTHAYASDWGTSTMTSSAPRRTVLAAALAAAAGVAAPSAQAADASRSTAAGTATPARTPDAPARRPKSLVDYHAWTTTADWARGRGRGTAPASGARPGIRLAHPTGTFDYRDPHTGRSATWEYATWTSPVHRLPVPATEVVASWNAHTPPGTWIAVELRGTYTDGGRTPWYVMGRWTAGDGDADIRRTSVDGQKDGKSSISTDTFAIDTPASGLRLTSYELRVTLCRRPGGGATPTVWRLGAMGSDLPDRFEVPASTPRLVGRELTVPRYSQEIHKGQYPEYDNGGEAWCSPTSSQMIVEYWGRKPTRQQLSWVNPDYADPQVCHAARYTFDYQYDGCGNWPFNAAYAATYRDLQSLVTRLSSLTDAERLIHAGIPVITSQSFLKTELDGAGYGTAGHLMTIVGFTKDGDVIANDPASPDDAAVRHVYRRRQFENVWLRTKRRNAEGKVVGGTGGVCYLYFPAKPAPTQHRVLRELGIR
ncbi:Peptidase_C39 like family protein [Streptomyces sp. 2112.3]|nr:peptidase C39-like protein [Streptomyces sp. 2321.6]SDR55892.1 Peptidase_C39 like family protein [Streptomyces sp. KS_16]SEC06872.1 Peptidase_C39 like family protein [Streptomyces sp. 2133.1]SEF09367.1 Peptidase_C39 like family protein [Streptomyces sp. 2112.3]SNC64400.1 Peptidase_C39 like family protein [Streptomyces sp. 2114.4]